MTINKRIYIAGHRGMVGSALVRQFENTPGIKLVYRTHDELELTDQAAMRDFFQTEKVDEVYMAAAKVGGIHANNTYPAEFIYDNLMVECNVIHEAYNAGVTKLMLLGSSCIYPKFAPQPMSENSLLKGDLEETNEPYAIAKIAGIKLCESYNRQYGVDYRSVMPTNLYGINDNFHPENSHVIPAMMRRFHESKERGDTEVVVWGTGKPMREFLHVDDMAAATIHVMNIDDSIFKQHTKPTLSHINVGTGMDCTIRELAETLKKVIGLDAELVFDTTKPDGTPRKLMDVSRLKQLGWQAQIDLEEGLAATYQWFLSNQGNYRQK